MTEFRMNLSLDEWVAGKASGEDIEVANNLLNCIIEDKKYELIDVLFTLVDKHEMLLPLVAAHKLVGLGRASMDRLLKRTRFDWIEVSVGEIIDDVAVRSGISRVNLHNDARNLKRCVICVSIFSDANSMADFRGDIWKSYFSVVKPNGYYLEGLSFDQGRRLALKRIGGYLDANYPVIPANFHSKIAEISRYMSNRQLALMGDLVAARDKEDFTKWFDIFDSFNSIRALKSMQIPNESMKILLSYLNLYDASLHSDPKVFLSQPRLNPSLLEYSIFSVDSYSELPTARRAAITYLLDMLRDFIETSMSEVDGDHTVCLGHMPHTGRQFMEFNSAAEGANNSRPSQSTSNPLPRKYLITLRSILTDNDWSWPKSLSSQIFHSEGTPVWNPVCAYLVFTMTEIPWRKIQVKCLDSGEGDLVEYLPKEGEWIANTSPHAGYWKNDKAARRHNRGVLSSQGRDFCFYVSTNKTNDRKQSHGEMSGYYVPWKNETLIQLFQALRKFQEKYNPVERPTHYGDVIYEVTGKRHPPADVVLESIPDRFYLFRDIQGSSRPDAPVSDNRLYSFWRLLMDELERRLHEAGDDCEIIATRDSSGGASTAHFNMHGLRVAGLSAFAESGIPIEVLSKLIAGHSSILMTIYYIKYNTAHITNILDDARCEIEAEATEKFKDFLLNKNYEKLSRRVVAPESEAFEQLTGTDFRKSPFFDTGLGICPHSGTRCDDGRVVGVKKYGPVNGGQKNCITCRHFVTGEPWLIPLVLNQQKLAIRAQDLAREIDGWHDKLILAEEERSSFICQNSLKRSEIPHSLARNISGIEHELDRATEEFNEAITMLNKGHALVEGIKALQDHDDERENLALLRDVDSDPPEIRTGTEFEVMDTVIQSSRVYHVLEDKNLEMRRERLLDAIMHHNGMVPISMMNLTNDQKRRAADSASEWFLRNIGAQETDLLIKGSLSFTQIGYDCSDLGAVIESVNPEAPALKSEIPKILEIASARGE